jgi:hypothetical protein
MPDVNNLKLITPDWQAPAHVKALSTTRHGGISADAYIGLNLADHVGDHPEHVLQNRALLCESLQLPQQPQWLHQTHSIRAIDLDHSGAREGDAAFTSMAGTVAVVLTADCLPVLFCNSDGSEVAAAHAGWRGLLNGVLEQTVQNMRSTPVDLMAWMGPAIGPHHFEVGDEVRAGFVQQSKDTSAFFKPTREGHFLADLYAIARLRLNKLGISLISGGDCCTWSDADSFYSYRRDRDTGRQASLIYINK